MSIWAEIHKRSNGKRITKEEFNEVYSGDFSNKTILEGNYRDCQYFIDTNGYYPLVRISVERPMSVFAGAGIVNLETEPGKFFNLERVSNGTLSNYVYSFNKDVDYVVNEHDGIQYSVAMLEDIIKLFIDRILKSEDDLAGRMNFSES